MERTLLSMLAGLDTSSGDRPPILSHDLPEDVLRSRMQEMKTWLTRQNDLPPCPAPPADRDALIRQQILRSQTMTSYNIKKTYVGSPKNSSTTPLEELTRVSISEMLLRKVHKGRFLLCRIVAPMVRMVASQTVVEDPAGAVTDLSIYNFPATGLGSSQTTLDLLFPIGTIMAIREPMLKLGTQGGNALIRVDTISDIVFLAQNESICSDVKWAFPLRSRPSPSTDELKKIGNGHFARGDWMLAVFAYSKGLRLDEDAFLLRLNRAEAYLRLSYYSAALFDAERVLSHASIDSKSRWKALWRAAKALYFQGRFAAARDRFEESRQFEGDVIELNEWFKRIDKREEELEHGSFDWARIFVESLKSPHIQHIADFRGPVEVRSLPDRGGGRGVIATAPIDIGQLLIVEKPFASVYSSDLPVEEGLISFNLLTNTLDSECSTTLISRVMERLWGNPENYDPIFNLYAGSDYPLPSVHHAQDADLSQARPFSTTGIQFPFQSTVDIDIMHLESIVSFNAFSPQPLAAFGEGHVSEFKSPAALYFFASLFNHSCQPNAVWFCFGNVIVIRATKPIAEGEEIYISYFSGSESFKTRQNALRKHFPSECRCELCVQDRADGISNYLRRGELVEKITSASSTQECRRLLKQIEATYSPSRVAVRPEMFRVKHQLAEAIRSELSRSISRSTLQSRLKEAIELDIDALRCIGISIQDHPSGLPISTDQFPFLSQEMLIAQFLAISVNYLNIEDHPRAVSWIKAAEWGHQVGLGGDKTLFKLLFRRLLDKMGVREYVYSVLQL